MIEQKEQLKSHWAQLEAVAGAEKRVGLVARDLVEHFERRLEAMDGKAMVVCMSRRICVDLYKAIVALWPEWHGDRDEAGSIKIVPAHHVRRQANARPRADAGHRPGEPGVQGQAGRAGGRLPGAGLQVLGDETGAAIAQELLRAVRNNVTIDWTLPENLRAKMRVLVKRILRRYGYPPDKQEKAT